MSKVERIAAVAAAGCIAIWGSVALAKGGPAPGLYRIEQVSGKVTVESFNPATRELRIKTDAGEAHTLKVPESLHNVGNLKPGDHIVATYARETEFVLSKPNQPLPKDADAIVSARAAKGQLPAGVVANYITVTGSVLGIDQGKHTLRIASPKGGEVHTVAVVTPEGKEAMKTLKVGDRITAKVTEAVLISTQRP